MQGREVRHSDCGIEISTTPVYILRRTLLEFTTLFLGRFTLCLGRCGSGVNQPKHLHSQLNSRDPTEQQDLRSTSMMESAARHWAISSPPRRLTCPHQHCGMDGRSGNPKRQRRTCIFYLRELRPIQLLCRHARRPPYQPTVMLRAPNSATSGWRLSLRCRCSVL
ncbi:hypothetical protein BJY01DRAFT_159963 [Aspergillus pseudoustus]|uniref:Uncharacterized protein n=1 Tax=Aspergillus pseudoustus TaxID=1810923 RepID=A0ABR4K7X5_9EURO